MQHYSVQPAACNENLVLVIHSFESEQHCPQPTLTLALFTMHVTNASKNKLLQDTAIYLKVNVVIKVWVLEINKVETTYRRFQSVSEQSFTHPTTRHTCRYLSKYLSGQPKIWHRKKSTILLKILDFSSGRISRILQPV